MHVEAAARQPQARGDLETEHGMPQAEIATPPIQPEAWPAFYLTLNGSTNMLRLHCTAVIAMAARHAG